MSSDLEVLLEKVDIVEFISRYVNLKRSGRNFVGLCPFHREKSPSFTVNPEKKLFYCFGCHVGGNVINFLMRFENLDFREALEIIAREYGIPLKDFKGKSKEYKEALEELIEFYHEQLKRNDRAIDYLKKRGIDYEVIREFRLGFSGLNPKSLLSKTRIPKDIFFSLGIFRVSGSEIVDIFSGRITIPIFDPSGNPIGFGGRALEEERKPKYINSPESPVFSKRAVLFGIEKAKKHILESGFAIIVEGYFDMVSLFRSGIKNSVAILGTSLTEEQLLKLKNYTQKIVLLMDGDEAGLKSALRSLDLFLRVDLQADIVLLPESEDPDTYVRKNGKEGILSMISKSMPIVDYYFHYQSKKFGLERPEKKIFFLKSVIPYIEKIKSSIHRSIYIKRLSELTGVNEEVLLSEIKGSATREEEKLEDEAFLTPLAKLVLGIAVSEPQLAESLGLFSNLNLVRKSELKSILERVSSLKERGELSLMGFLNDLEEKLRNHIVSCIFESQTLEKEEKVKAIKDFIDHERRIALKEKLKLLTEKLKEAETTSDQEKISEILREKDQILRALKN